MGDLALLITCKLAVTLAAVYVKLAEQQHQVFAKKVTDANQSRTLASFELSNRPAVAAAWS